MNKNFSINSLGGVSCLAVSPDSKYIAAGTENKIFGLFDLQRKTHLHAFQDVHQSNQKYFSYIFSISSKIK